MPIEDFYARSETDVVTFAKTQLHFSASLVEKHNLLEYDYARMGFDSELRRIYFAFQENGGPGILRFFRQTGKSKRKMIAMGFAYASYDWVAAVRDKKENAKRQFELEVVDPQDTEIYPKYKYFITVGYAWAPERDFHDESNYPEEPGVYRLKKDGEIVRIGEGNNISRRLKDHHKDYHDEVNTFDFEIVHKDEERLSEQKRLFEAFRVNVGRLPKLNPIGN